MTFPVGDEVDTSAQRLGAPRWALVAAAAQVLAHRCAGESGLVVEVDGVRTADPGLTDEDTFREVVSRLRVTSAGNPAVTINLGNHHGTCAPRHDDLGAVPGLASHLGVLLAAAATEPDRPVGDLPLLTAADLHYLVHQWNRTESLPGPVTLPSLFAAQALRTPGATAVVDDTTRLTYRELDRESNRLAHELRARGVGPETGVGVCLERSATVVVAFLAVLKAGGVYVPVDPDYPNERIALMLAESRARVVVTDSVLAGTLPVDRRTCLLLDEVDPAARDDEPPPTGVGVDNLCAVMFTSGSTGVPKCAMLTHANVANYAHFWARVLATTPMRAHVQMAGMAFVIFLGDVVRALFSGATLVISPRETTLAPAELHDLMVREGVNSAEFVPPVLKLLVDFCEATGTRLDFLDLLVAGGDIWHTTDYLRAKELCGVDTQIVSAYGMTETSIDNTTLVNAELDDDDPTVPIGRPTPGTRCYVLDARLRPVPVGVPGELYVAGPGVCRGYLDRPDRTAERFVADPFSPGARMYRTGDRAVLRADGALRVLGRTDNQVKIDGVRVEPGEVEAALRAHPAITDAVVVVEGPPTDRRLAAFVVTRDTAAVTGPLHTHLREHLPPAAVPATITPVDRIILNQHGKVDRRLLRSRAHEPQDDQLNPDSR